MPQHNPELLLELAGHAWRARQNALVHGNTRVGCAVLSATGKIFVGCNVEHRFRCHDVHAEINALTTMVAQGESTARAIVIVAERERFTPCGGCMDWIMQIGGPDAIVAFQRAPDASFVVHTARDLMPYYPE